MSYTVVLAYMPGLRYEFHSTDEYRESLPQGEEDRHPCKYVETDLSASLCGLLDEFCNRLGEGGHSFLVTRFAMKAVATVIMPSRVLQSVVMIRFVTGSAAAETTLRGMHSVMFVPMIKATILRCWQEHCTILLQALQEKALKHQVWCLTSYWSALTKSKK